MNIRDNADAILAQLDQEQRRAQLVEMIRVDIAPGKPRKNRCLRVLKYVGLAIVAAAGLIAFSLWVWVIVMVAKYQ